MSKRIGLLYSLIMLWIGIGILLVEASPLKNDRNQKRVLHERRNGGAPMGWTKLPRGTLPLDLRIPVRIAVKEENLHLLDEYLMNVSTPGGENYGNHWSQKKIERMFRPRRERVGEVVGWLVEEGVERKRIRVEGGGSWVSFEGGVREVEKLLGMSLGVWKHGSGVVKVGGEEYWVPEHIQDHIDFITPTVHFDARIDPRKENIKRDDNNSNSLQNGGVGFGEAGHNWRHNDPNKNPCPKPSTNITQNLLDCSNNIIPDCLRALYGIPTLDPKTRRHPNNSFGVVEYTPQSYIASDLIMFFSNYSKNQIQTKPTLHSVDGGNVYSTPDLARNIESDLDLEYAMALVNPLNVTLYQVGDLIETDYTSFNNFLDALDTTYCADNETVSVGPNIDAIYPDPLPGGYTGPRNCGGYTAAKVISTSYSYNEHDLTPAYERRQCNEYAKLGLAGTTFLYCSGDYGVAGSLNRCIDPSTGNFGSTTSGKFAPSFPSTCPYVLSVGATQMVKNSTIHDQEVACETSIYSGGGFSNVFEMPNYQAQAVKNYLRYYKPSGFGGERYNNSGLVRAYPDVSANGANYVVALTGSLDYRVFGTSASTPVFAAILTLVNEARLNVGKGTVGFINPALYANPWLLNDVVKGSNPGCGTDGFEAAPGWDPVTGLGTPNYPRLLQYFLTH